MPESPCPIIEVSDLHFSYSRLKVLFGVSLHVERGEALALLGTNGAGKSTLLRVICGLERPSSGRVRLNGRDISGEPAEQLASCGMVLIPGGRAIFSDLTVKENLKVQAIPLGRDKREVAARLDKVFTIFPALASRVRKRAGTLSGGQQQQLALAKALLVDASVICIDELSLGLSPTVIDELISTVQALSHNGITVIVVEQSLSVAAEICQRAVFMEKGEVRFEGRTVELLEREDLSRAVFFGT